MLKSTRYAARRGWTSGLRVVGGTYPGSLFYDNQSTQGWRQSSISITVTNVINSNAATVIAAPRDSWHAPVW